MTHQRSQRSALACVFSMVFLSSALFAQDYIVKFKSEESFSRFKSQRQVLGASVADHHARGRLLLIQTNQRFSKKEEAQFLAQVMKNPEVEYVVNNWKIKAFDLPNDPEISKQWSLKTVEAAKAWKSGVGSKDIIVAITDTGIDHAHADLKDNMWVNKGEIPGNGIDDDGNGYVDDVYGYDFRDNDGDPMDATSAQNPGHGTHCAGIVGAVGDNGVGISGMSQRVSLMASRFLGADGSGDLMGAIKSIDYATDNGAHIISASWGAATNKSQAQPIIDAIERARVKGVLFVAAASNDGKNNDRYEVYPANAGLSNVITVAASTSSEAKPSWSNYGRAKVSLSSPGEKIYSTLPGNKYGELSGTSMATPLVSGLAALLLTQEKDLKPMDVKAILQSTGKKIEIETACNCRVDASSAIDRVKTQALTVVPQAATLAPEETLQFSAWGGKGPFRFISSDENIATVSDKGLLTAKAEGEVKVSLEDGRGQVSESLSIYVKVPSSEGEPGGECPLGDPALCQAICQIMPDLPWC